MAEPNAIENAVGAPVVWEYQGRKYNVKTLGLAQYAALKRLLRKHVPHPVTEAISYLKDAKDLGETERAMLLRMAYEEARPKRQNTVKVTVGPDGKEEYEDGPAQQVSGWPPDVDSPEGHEALFLGPAFAETLAVILGPHNPDLKDEDYQWLAGALHTDTDAFQSFMHAFRRGDEPPEVAEDSKSGG